MYRYRAIKTGFYQRVIPAGEVFTTPDKIEGSWFRLEQKPDERNRRSKPRTVVHRRNRSDNEPVTPGSKG